jgi:putative endonuclease
MKNKRLLGQEVENLATEYLKNQGYEIIDRNFQCKIGEIDIIARQGKTFVFIEVKSKTGLGYGSPEEMVDKCKQYKLIRTAEYYLKQKEQEDISWRIDVVAVELSILGEIGRIELIKNAVHRDYSV